jgi:hypothetical protein
MDTLLVTSLLLVMETVCERVREAPPDHVTSLRDEVELRVRLVERETMHEVVTDADIDVLVVEDKSWDGERLIERD